MDAGFKVFHIFYAKKRPFFRFLDPPYFRAGGLFFFQHFTKIFAPEKFSGRVLLKRATWIFVFFFDFIFIFFILPKDFHFPVEKKKRRRRRRERKKYIFFRFFFSKNNLAKFWKFWDFLRGGFTVVSIGKVSFSAKCLFGRIGGLKNFWEKKIGCRIRNFSHFLCHKTTFFRFLDPPPYFRAEARKKNRQVTKNFALEKN